MAFLVASLTAVRSRRRAGLIFLGSAPFVAFLLSYPSAGYLVWEPDGSGVFQLPLLPTAVRLACVYYLPFVAPLFFLRRRRRALWVFLIALAIATPDLMWSRWTAALLPRLAGWSTPFLLFGGFWLLTDRKGWPALRSFQPRPVAARILRALVQSLAVVLLAVVGIFALAVARSTLFTPDCSGSRLFVKPVGPGHAVFTARLVWAGHTAKVNGRWAGDWAIGVVQENFWGLPQWAPHLVLLTNHMYREGETFFISGSRQHGILTRFLPIVDATDCGKIYAWPLAYAKIQLQLLRKPLRPGESRIIGTVLSPLSPGSVSRPERQAPRGDDRTAVYEWAFNSPATDRPLTGARIQVTSSSGATIISTDSDGMYELVGLRPDNYTLKLLDVPPNQAAEDLVVKKENMAATGADQLDIHTAWAGSIDGSIEDSGGGPADVSLELENADGMVPVYPNPAARSARDGSFRFPHLPTGGRYVLLINSFGPWEDSPYSRMYYPAAKRREDARVFEIGGSRQFRDLHVVVTRQARRALQVRVKWPNGHPADDTWVHFAYEHAEYYDRLESSTLSRTADRAGVAELNLFGDARIRVQAVKAISSQTGPDSYRYSSVVELETNRLPPSLDLILSSSQRPVSH